MAYKQEGVHADANAPGKAEPSRQQKDRLITHLVIDGKEQICQQHNQQT